MPPAATKTVLIVEDDESVRTMLARALGVKYTISQAADGLEAIEMLKTIAPPDLIICDVMMPKMNGYAMTRMLKADEKLRLVPIVFLTARSSAKDVVLGINAGARHYISKPFSVRDVLDKVGKILK